MAGVQMMFIPSVKVETRPFTESKVKYRVHREILRGVILDFNIFFQYY